MNNEIAPDVSNSENAIDSHEPDASKGGLTLPSDAKSGGIWLIAAGLTVAVAIAFWFAWTNVAQQQANGNVKKFGAAGLPMPSGQITGDQSEQINVMIENLATRLKTNPSDLAGWAMLARTCSVVGRIPEAVDAYAKAVALSRDDAGLLVDYADALGVKNNHSLEGEPIKLIERALKIAPQNVKALALAGTYAFDHQDYSAAVRYWDKVVEIGGADNMFAQRIQFQLERARQLSSPNPAVSSAASLSGGTVANSDIQIPVKPSTDAGNVSGVVTLLPSLHGAAKPDDAVFIFVRAAQGSPMPLAILRRQVKDLPVSFTLNLNAAPLSALDSNQVQEMRVFARVSKSGNAVASKGDLAGQSKLVKAGAKDVSIEINQVINP